jgi:hypothetical protein
VAAALLIWLQLLIIVTGNYAFFNLLSIALCTVLFDDAALRRLAPPRLRGWISAGVTRSPAPIYYRLLAVPPTAAIVLLSGVHLVDLLPVRRYVPRRARTLAGHLARLHLVNRYGLFAVMTTTRPEIVVEGSRDGHTWVEYAFRYKPGDIHRRPPWVAPHQPRLDWQMWFAALGSPWSNRWFSNFMVRLLEGRPEVLGLLQTNPFPEEAPRYVRALLYDYRFSDPATRRAEGAWWRRELRGLYFPPVSLQQD